MTDQTVTSPTSILSAPGKFLALVPGIALLAVIGYAGKFIEQSISAYGKANHLALPNIEYVLWAIIIGLVIGNSVRLPKVFAAGVDTYEFFLKLGIVLLGVRFLLGDVSKLGGVSLALVGIELVMALWLMTVIGRYFGLKPKLISLLAIGSSICGVSAIIAAKGAIEAEDEDASFAIAAILGIGVFGLFAYPVIGHWIGLSDQAFGVWAGLAVDNTAEATAAGALYSDVAGKFAVLTKTTRNATIGFVVLGYALYWAKQGQAQAIGHKGKFLWEKFPKFILGFLAISLLATLGVFDKPQTTSLANLSRWAFLLTFAGVGLKTNFAEMRRQGIRPFVVGALGELLITALTLGMVVVADDLIGL